MTEQLRDFVSMQVKKPKQKPKSTVLDEIKRLRRNQRDRINYKK